PGRLRVLEQFLRRERRRFDVRCFVSRRQRVVRGIGRPDMNVGIDEIHASPRSSTLVGLLVSYCSARGRTIEPAATLSSAFPVRARPSITHSMQPSSRAVGLITELPGLAPRPSDSNKGNYGKVLVVAGSRGMSGAAVLCGSAAL